MIKTFPMMMTIGDIITASFKLYLTNFQKFYWTTLKGMLWFLVPDLASRLLPLFLGSQKSSLFVIGANLLLIYFWANYFAGVLVVERLAFNELLVREESEETVRKAVLSKKWSLLWSIIPGTLVLISFIVVVAFTGFIIIRPPTSHPEAYGFLLAISVIASLLLLSFAIWVITRFSFVYIALIIEDSPSTLQALKRSWALSKKSVLRLQVISTLGLILASPLIGLSYCATYLIHVYITSPWLSVPLELLKFVLIPPLYLPFLNSVWVLAYLDLISRREGADF
jgi:hypothetical protein